MIEPQERSWVTRSAPQKVAPLRIVIIEPYYREPIKYITTWLDRENVTYSIFGIIK